MKPSARFAPAHRLWQPMVLLAASAMFPHAVSAAPPSSGLSYDRTWKHAEFYKNSDNPVIQSVAFTGRYQLDYAVVDRNDFDDLNTRRWRMGAKIQMFGNLLLHTEADFDPDEDPLYQRLTDTYLAWSRSKTFTLTVGKHGAGFTLDGMTSSKELLTIDRSNLANNLWFPQEYMPGVSGSGRIDRWRYHVGVYSAGSSSREFGHFDGSTFMLYTLGYDFAQRLGAEKAVLAGNYVFQDPHPRNDFTRQLHHIGSLTFTYEQGKGGFRSDLSAATGIGTQSDLWGFLLMPFYNMTRQLQGVVRYTYLSSTDNDGIGFPRYESEAVRGRGDEYNEIYAGLNCYFYGHKLKLQTGLQHVDMDDDAKNGGGHSGWSWTTGLRVSW